MWCTRSSCCCGTCRAAANYSRLLPYSRLTRAAGTRYSWPHVDSALQRSKLIAQAGPGALKQNCSLSGLNVLSLINNCSEILYFLCSFVLIAWMKSCWNLLKCTVFLIHLFSPISFTKDKSKTGTGSGSVSGSGSAIRKNDGSGSALNQCAFKNPVYCTRMYVRCIFI